MNLSPPELASYWIVDTLSHVLSRECWCPVYHEIVKINEIWTHRFRFSVSDFNHTDKSRITENIRMCLEESYNPGTWYLNWDYEYNDEFTVNGYSVLEPCLDLVFLCDNDSELLQQSPISIDKETELLVNDLKQLSVEDHRELNQVDKMMEKLSI